MSELADFTKPVERHKFWFQYVTTPTADTPGTVLLLHFDNKRYLFGRITEGSQRACIERGVSLKKVRNLFLTGETRWEHQGGILGMVLTMADVIVETTEEDQRSLGDILIYGGPKIWHKIAAARRFIFRTSTPLKVFEAQPKQWKISRKPDYSDENVQIWALPVRRSVRRDSSPIRSRRRSTSPATIEREQALRQKTVHDMFDSDWRKDRLYESAFKDVSLPAMVWVRDPETKDLSSTFCTKMEDAPHIRPDQKVLVRLPWPAALVSELPSADNLPSSISMCYFIKGRPQRGHFQMQKAKDAGVKPGPNFGILASGRSVTLEGGQVIKPEDVMDAPLPGYGMAVLDVPHEQYLPDLLQKLKGMQEAQILVDVHAFMWTLGSGVLHSQAFADFKAQFAHVKHVISSPDGNHNYLAMQASASSASRLNQIRPETFPLPKFESTRQRQDNSDPNTIQADRGMILQVAPEYAVKTDEVPAHVNLSQQAAGLAPNTRALIPSVTAPPSDEKYADVSVQTLGTGSALPSKYRNVSSNLLHIPSLGYFLFDAGENTLGQLKRSYSPEELEHILCNLHMIWISHLHADHHLGTISILIAHKVAVQKRQAAGSPVTHKLYVVSEENLADYLEDYRSIQASDAVLLRCLQSVITDVDRQPVKLTDTTLPISKLSTCRVSHCQRAQAISVTFANGFKLSYSGDCRPSPSFVDIGQDSDVLIHEATFDDGLEGDAIAKKHSTIGEALGVAYAMRAKNVILTHFSQRYQKLPTLSHVRPPQQLRLETADDEADPAGPMLEAGASIGDSTIPARDKDHSRQNSGPTSISAPNGLHGPLLKKQTSLQEAAEEMSICIAFDLMRVTIPQIKDMYKYYPAIESMFEHEQAKSDDKKSEMRAVNEAMALAKSQRAQKHKNKARPMTDDGQQNRLKNGRNDSQSAKKDPKNKERRRHPPPTTHLSTEQSLSEAGSVKTRLKRSPSPKALQTQQQRSPKRARPHMSSDGPASNLQS